MSYAELTVRFTNLPLRFPAKAMDLVENYTQTKRANDEGSRGGDFRPFERYVDLWWAALCVGVREGRQTTEAECGGWHKFIDANQILPSDPWRAEHLMLLAVGITGNTEILERPSQIIEMANQFAATGYGLLIESMAADSRPIRGATAFLLAKSGASQEGQQSD